MFTLRLLRGCHAVRRVTLACCSSRLHSHVVSFLSRERLRTPGLRTLWSSIPCWKGRSTGHWDGGDNGDWSSGEESEEDEDVEELSVSRTPAIYGAQKIVIVHPDVKWGDKRQRDTTAELLVAEAVALIHSIPNWIVVDKIIMSTKSPDHKYVFGKGNFHILTEKIKGIPRATAVFLNIERISPLSESYLSCGSSIAKDIIYLLNKPPEEALAKRVEAWISANMENLFAQLQPCIIIVLDMYAHYYALHQTELEAAWGVKVFDRYAVVLNIFRYNARTKEAKLQIALAELPLLRSQLINEMAHLDQQGGGSRYIMGSGETFMQIQQRLLNDRELKLKKALEKLRKKRKLLRTQRKRWEFPVISVMGYTNSGKTTLIKALTGDAKLQPCDQLFATLDVTAHGGLLPCRMPVIYVDTIGFLSQLPHNLIESFSATLEDVIHSDLIIHVRDISHPEAINQKKSVLNVLSNLNVPQKLLDAMIEVHNKIDLVEEHNTKEAAVPVSALLGYGLEDLKQRIETGVIESTGRIVATIRVNLESAQLSWLYKEASVQEVKVLPEDGAADVLVMITSAAYGKYMKLFCK